MKAFADGQMNVTHKRKLDLERVEKIVGNGENVVLTFSPFPTMFSNGLFFNVIESNDYVVELPPHQATKKSTDPT